MSSYSGRSEIGVLAQKGTKYYGTTYEANNSQSTASSHYNGLEKSTTTGRMPARQYSGSKPADQYYYSSISSSQTKKLGGGGANSSEQKLSLNMRNFIVLERQGHDNKEVPAAQGLT
uniref:Uncharacterized protein n=1 Tax=Leersia perrieri TaxID=77586 RepID=A0A0D9X719_9ORYZ